MCPVAPFCTTRGETATGRKVERQKKREVHCALSQWDGQVFLTQRPRHASLMAGMWELPEISRPAMRNDPDFVLRHSITVTDYTVSVWRVRVPEGSRGKWIPEDRLPKIALTGLARKILRIANVEGDR